MTPHRLGWLDGLRGWAALVVFGFHLSPSILGPRIHLAIYRHIDLGKYGVLLFFLVSGYVIPMSLERHGCLRRFWIGRLCRIYPAYLATIGVVVLLFGWRGGTLAHASMLVDPLGVRGAVRVFWTLSYEMIFYLVVSGLFAWRLHRLSAWWAIGLALAAVGLGPVLPNGLLSTRWTPAVLLVLLAAAVGAFLLRRDRAGAAISLLFILVPALNGHPTARSTVVASWQALLLLAVMFTGTALYRLRERPVAAVTAVAVVTAALVVAHPAHAQWATVTAAVAATVALAYAGRHRPVPRALRFVGRISYSLYLLHVVVLMVVLRWLPALAQRPLPVRVAAALAVIALTLGVSTISWRWVEVPGQRLGRWLTTQRAFARTA